MHLGVIPKGLVLSIDNARSANQLFHDGRRELFRAAFALFGTNLSRIRFRLKAKATKEVAVSDLRKLLGRAALVAVVAGSVLATTAAPASAYVVCNRHHCWHRHHYYPYYGSYYGGDPYYRGYYGPAYYGRPYYGPAYDGPGYYGPDYYPGYYGPGISFSFGFGHGGFGHRR
jgi:hypothetical protein